MEEIALNVIASPQPVLPGFSLEVELLWSWFCTSCFSLCEFLSFHHLDGGNKCSVVHLLKYICRNFRMVKKSYFKNKTGKTGSSIATFYFPDNNLFLWVAFPIKSQIFCLNCCNEVNAGNISVRTYTWMAFNNAENIWWKTVCSTTFVSLYLYEKLMPLLIFTGGSDVLGSVSVLMYPWEYFG